MATYQQAENIVDNLRDSDFFSNNITVLAGYTADFVSQQSETNRAVANLAWQRRRATAIAVVCGILFGLGIVGGGIAIICLAPSSLI